MRNIILLLVFATLAITCNKKDDPAPPAPHRNTLSATVNGADFNVSSYAIWVEGEDGNVAIIGNTGSFKLTLLMFDYNGIKDTFQLNQDLASGSICQEPCGPLDYSTSYEGELIISSFNKTTYKEGEVITGTFHFETDLMSRFSVTNGNFSVMIPNN